ncbi:hypothetical protein PMIN06_003091 [Paraphaeosphaeria minitans]
MFAMDTTYVNERPFLDWYLITYRRLHSSHSDFPIHDGIFFQQRSFSLRTDERSSFRILATTFPLGLKLFCVRVLYDLENQARCRDAALRDEPFEACSGSPTLCLKCGLKSLFIEYCWTCLALEEEAPDVHLGRGDQLQLSSGDHG